MKAIAYMQYGSPDVLTFQETEKPTPKENEVLVKVHAAAINKGNLVILEGKPYLARLMAGGLFRPKRNILGNDIAGQVVAVGKNVQQFQPGDAVFGESGFGGFAEYVCAPETTLVLKPANITFAQAAAVPLAAVTALRGIRAKNGLQPGQKVLINGASGGVGTFAILIAKAVGAEVTAVCSTGKIEMVRAIGADHAIDYTKEDSTKNGQKYDLIIGVNGYRSLSDYKRALTSDGTYVCTGGEMAQVFQSMLLGPFISKVSSQKIINIGVVKSSPEELAFIRELLETGKIVPVIDRCYPLNEVPTAFRYLEKEHAKGKIVITVADNMNINNRRVENESKQLTY
ncbi:NAD(P)-dependent alcohol dehydrogenase [Candidatus Leptofilum sp.]|uniref:NAD(P)-dependent alcohol dehydrogenase n=1 Tax=Candidatus Leptofilum sp. TaxID=3241576 RepID=UPI003B59F84C